MIPTDCSVLCTLTILPPSFAYREIEIPLLCSCCGRGSRSCIHSCASAYGCGPETLVSFKYHHLPACFHFHHAVRIGLLLFSYGSSFRTDKLCLKENCIGSFFYLYNLHPVTVLLFSSIPAEQIQTSLIFICQGKWFLFLFFNPFLTFFRYFLSPDIFIYGFSFLRVIHFPDRTATQYPQTENKSCTQQPLPHTLTLQFLFNIIHSEPMKNTNFSVYL